MALSNEIASQFAKTVANKDKSRSENAVYGTVVVRNGEKYVRMDGSDLLTPCGATVNAINGERVLILVKNHSVIINGNLSSPAARLGDLDDVSKVADESWKKLVAWAKDKDLIYIDGANLYSGSVNADKINVNDLFALNIEASGSIIGVKIEAREMSAKESYSIFNGKNIQKILYFDGTSIKLGKMGTGTEIANGAGFEFFDKSINVYGNLTFMSGDISTPGAISSGKEISAASNVKTGDNFLANNGHGLWVADTSGNYRSVVDVNSSDQVVVGYGHAAAKRGQLCLMGRDIVLYSGLYDTWIRPYYVPGDACVNMRYKGGGFITGSKANLHFCIPLSRPCVGVTSVSVVSNPGLIIRQGGNYLYGSGADTNVQPEYYEATLADNCISVMAHFANTTNVVTNNDACGVSGQFTVYFN